MSSVNEAVKMLLKRVWWAESFANDSGVDFARIDDEARTLVPSTTEELLVRLARHLYSRSGTVDLALLLDRADASNRAVILEALATYCGLRTTTTEKEVAR